jgi:hypothetical protein
MDEFLSIDEIKSRFDSEWVLLGDPEVSKEMEILGGKVLSHSKDRDEVYQKAVELRPKRSATLYLGSIPEGTEIVV